MLEIRVDEAVAALPMPSTGTLHGGWPIAHLTNLKPLLGHCSEMSGWCLAEGLFHPGIVQALRFSPPTLLWTGVRQDEHGSDIVLAIHGHWRYLGIAP